LLAALLPIACESRHSGSYSKPPTHHTQRPPPPANRKVRPEETTSKKKKMFFFSPSLPLTGVALIARSQRGTILSAHKRKRTESKQHTCNRHLKSARENQKNDDLADDLAEKHSDPADSAAKAHADS
jgi:hypothetical protein